jgi:hypothetical protein
MIAHQGEDRPALEAAGASYRGLAAEIQIPVMLLERDGLSSPGQVTLGRPPSGDLSAPEPPFWRYGPVRLGMCRTVPNWMIGACWLSDLV